MTKTCSRCKQTKTVTEFNKGRQRSDGLNSFCKQCNKEYLREHYQRNKQYYANKRKKAQQKLKEWFKEIKAALTCEECNEAHAACLDFHHKNPLEKDLNIARMIGNFTSRSKILNEIEKCIPLCSNCHRKLHYNKQG